MIKCIKHAIGKSIPFLMACLTCSCFVSPFKNHRVHKITLIYNIPILHTDGVLKNYSDSLEIYHYDQQFLIQIPYTYALENATEILKKETRFSYFFYLEDSTSGFYFDKQGVAEPKKLSVDSFLAMKTFKNFNFFDQNNDSLIQTIKSANKTVIEKYIPKKKPDQSYPDTTYLYYNKKFNDLDLYRFSKLLDSTKRMKLFKVEMKYNSQFYDGYSFKFPEREFLFHLKESKKPNREIIGLFKTLKEKISSNTSK
jgi:hypothetical protein